ncbi:MAG: T9SS C-terminal target domain-containing protein [Bacteroidetes bacterium]|nr:MAG: T9SS C-terminal target domain-containing protein [Bacteroidota bacterium]
MKTFTRSVITVVCGIYCFFFASVQPVHSQNLTCTFTMAEIACLEQHVKVTYTGNATSGDSAVWNFDGAVILDGSGLGPYWIKWLTTGEKHVTLNIQQNGETCTYTRGILIVELPAVFNMTGGGSYPSGGIGVPIGLSGSQPGVIYKLRRNGNYTGNNKVGTGNPIEFGLQTEAGTYDCVANIDGSECIREMEGVAVVTITGGAIVQHICMVSFDTLTNKNILIWNKVESDYVSHFNVYRETYLNNHYEKIAEVPYSSFSTYIDTTADPLIKTDKYKLSVTDTLGNEFEKSPPHKTIHLNINPGIYGFNLIWNHYEGFEFLTYKILRKLSTDPWLVLDSVASNVDSYTDLYTTTGLATYFIEVLRPEPCHPTKGSEYSSVISNTATAAPLGLEEDKLSGILIYPNPVRERLFLSVPGEGKVLFTLEIYRPDGRKVHEDQVRNGTTEIDVTGLQSGMYILKLKGNTASVVKKFFKN